MATLVKCGRKYINLDHVDAIEKDYYYRDALVKVLFSGAEDWTIFRISDEEFKEFEASLAKYTN